MLTPVISRAKSTRFCHLIVFSVLLLSAVDGTAQSEQTQPGSLVPGLYFDVARSGHGFDLQPVGRRWVMVFYTYDANGLPEWMLGVLERDDNGALSGSLDYFTYEEDRFPRQAPLRTAGTVSLNAMDCGAGTQVQTSFAWNIEGEQGEWCMQPLLDQSATPESDFTGLWYAGTEDQGWGISLDFSGLDEQTTEVQILFYYDDMGLPRWAYGDGAGGPEASIEVRNFEGYCRLCEPGPLKPFAAGRITHQLGVVDGLPLGEIDVDVSYELGAGEWVRSASPLIQLSDPALGLVQPPEIAGPERVMAIVNVNVIPMAEPEVTLENQTVIVRDGVIAALGDFESVGIPENAIRIDGRGKYLGPGLHDMHTHFTFGGTTAMREAGTLYVANGVTTVLNMGDGGTQNLPGTDDLFASGEFIGPRVYAGQAAYGPNDGRSATLTVNSAAAATSYAERLVAGGYRFIKLYNALTPLVVAQFFEEGLRLDLPVNGHLPKTMSMRDALEGGLGMVAHVAEVYFTELNNQPNESLLPQAAALLLENNVYLTDTLTASESFAANYGGNEANFLIFSRRNGIQYQPTSFAENGWVNFFHSNTLQPSGSAPGQLDDRLVFFKQMVKYFNDAGVPIILGTDAPGHIGVIAGFSVHEALRLYREIGFSNFDAYAAGSRNPGNYFADTLEPEIEWGTVALGMRADLLLLDGDPLESLENLRAPLGVMIQGRWYSKAFLDKALQALDDKYQDPFSSKSTPTPDMRLDLHGPWCDHDV